MSDLTITHAGNAVTRSADSPGSSISTARRRIIRITPTLDTSTYAAGDVVFNSVEIPNAVLGHGGCSKLIAMFIVNQITTLADFDFIFSENAGTLGSVNATANIGDAEIEAMNITGYLKLDSSEANTGNLDNSKIQRVFNNSNTENVSPILLQAAPGSTSAYIAAIETSGTNPTFQFDSMDLVFHIEY